MKTTLIGHAAILIESCGTTILSDPWWTGPCFGAQWWVYPQAATHCLTSKSIDYVYVSHGHNDHLHPGTLATLSKDATVIVSSEVGIAEGIRELGFTVITIGPDEEHELTPGLRCRIIPTSGGDTLMAVTDGAETCLNLNDALHSKSEETQQTFIKKLSELYPKIDYVFCGYGTASHFPNCFVIPGKDRVQSAIKRQHHFNQQWVNVISGLKPKFGFPFAADVVLLEDELFWTNEPVHNGERPTRLFEELHGNSATIVLDVAPGFAIEDGEIVTNALRGALDSTVLASDYKAQIQRANRYPATSQALVDELADLLRQNIKTSLDYLLEWSEDYVFLLAFRNSDLGIEIAKTENTILVTALTPEAREACNYDVVYRTRAQYLRWSLAKEHGHEILFVGSGGVFEYRDRTQATQNLHGEFRLLMTRRANCPASRFGSSSRQVHRLKSFAKRVLGMDERSLYDLDDWTVYANRETTADAR